MNPKSLPILATLSRITSLVVLLAPLIAGGGCKSQAPSSAAETGTPGPSLQRNRIFRLELDTLTVKKIVGSGGDANSLKALLADYPLYVWTPEKEAQIAWVGFTGAPGSFARSSYTRVKFIADPYVVRMDPFAITLQLRDGRKLELDVNAVTLRDGHGKEAAGVLDDDVRLEARGGFGVLSGETRLSGDFEGLWSGEPDKTSPEVHIDTPADGVPSGVVRVFFDEPVRTTSLPERVFIRDAERRSIEIDVTAERGDILDATTQLLVKPRGLLPFDARLSVAIASEIPDLLNRRLGRAALSVVATLSSPPSLAATFHDFAVARGEAEFTKVGAVDLIPAFGVELPSSGRFLRLLAPPAVGTTSAAVLTRFVVNGTARALEVRVKKIARTRDVETPCLRVTLSSPKGVVFSVDCGPTEVPKQPITGPELAGAGAAGSPQDREWVATPWSDLSVPLEGQRGQEVLVIIEAPPLSPTMNPAALTQFLVDFLRVVP